jgi:hypothetical protein
MITRSLSLFLPKTAILLSVGLGFVQSALADVKCLRAVNTIKNGKVVTALSRVTRANNCKVGEIKTSSLSGVYGDGSAGAKTISSPETLSDATSTYTDVVVNSGTVWTVPSGTVIRCTGTFTNNGSILIQNGAIGGRNVGLDTTTLFPSYTPPHPGVSVRAAASGESGDTANVRVGGYEGIGLSEYQSSLIRYPGPFAGGGGAGGSSSGGSGGGSLVVLCDGAITNNGLISAPGQGGSLGTGGGAGGVIILGSRTSAISSAGSFILADGAGGGDSTISTGPGGGGGGGIIHLLAPAVNTTGATISVQGGSYGNGDNPLSALPRSGGHGGGGCGGSGGKGGNALNTDPGIALGGSDGHIIYSLVDPTPLF